MEILGWTLVIFFARVADVGLGTIRVQFIVRRKKLPAAMIGFVEVLIFILIVSRVIRDIQHWPYVLAYAGGFAAGTLLGMYLSEKFAQRRCTAFYLFGNKGVVGVRIGGVQTFFESSVLARVGVLDFGEQLVEEQVGLTVDDCLVDHVVEVVLGAKVVKDRAEEGAILAESTQLLRGEDGQQ